MNADHLFRIYMDHAAPRLDTYEQAIYLYLVRHGPLDGVKEIVFPIESSTSRLALCIAKKGARISRDVVRRKLVSLQKKGFVRIVGVEYRGTRVEVLLPSEIDGLVKADHDAPEIPIDELDFFSSAADRDAIFTRDGERCFYCDRTLTAKDRVLDHVVSGGGNGYRNLVASCLGSSSRKGSSDAEGFLRTLFRNRLLSETDLHQRMNRLDDSPCGSANAAH